jgi:hypothetical protein
MIHITIKTKRVYSHSGDGMPKFETINTTVEDGSQFVKFIKYLPFRSFIPKDLGIVKVVEDGKEIDKTKWVKALSEAVSNMTKIEPTITEKYETEKRRNDELNERLIALEEKLGKDTENPAPVNVDMEELKKAYTEKTGKKPYYGWDAETLTKKINE